MADWAAELEKVKITTQLRIFLRAELQMAFHFTDENGNDWNPSSVEAQIRKNDNIPGFASDDTLRRFVYQGYEHKTQRQALLAVMGFLLEFEFITLEDIEGYARAGHERAALSLSQMFASGDGQAQYPNGASLEGSYRSYDFSEDGLLRQVTLSIVQADQGKALTTVLRVVQYHFATEKRSEFLKKTGNLSPQRMPLLTEALDEYESEIESRNVAHGACVAAPGLLFALAGGDTNPLYELLVLDQVHATEGSVTGIRANAAKMPLSVADGEAQYSERPKGRPLTGDRLEFYPQDNPVDWMPVIEDEDRSPVKGGDRGDPIKFMSEEPPSDHLRQTLDRTAEILAEADSRGMETTAALQECADATERLLLAIDLHRPDAALAAVQEGAVLNMIHPSYDLPVVHTVAAFGMRKVVMAILERGGVDLTVRDRFGRLASACADNCAEDFALRDMLVKAEITQFREKGIDPRRPTAPNYGSYILTREPSA